MQSRQLMFTALGRKPLWFLLTFVLTLGIGQNLAMAAVPDNDNFSAATDINGPTGTFAVSTVEATAEPAEPGYSYNDWDFPAHNSIWYKWTAPSAASITFDTSGSSFDTVLAIYTGSTVDALNPIAFNDDDPNGNNGTSRITFTPTSGATYHIAVDGFDTASGDSVLNWAPAYTLTVVKVGVGTVKSADGGIDCGDDCSEYYSFNTSVTLTATTPTFTGWSGEGCTGTGDCTVTMDGNKTITAYFKDKFPWSLFSPKAKKVK